MSFKLFCVCSICLLGRLISKSKILERHIIYVYSAENQRDLLWAKGLRKNFMSQRITVVKGYICSSCLVYLIQYKVFN